MGILVRKVPVNYRTLKYAWYFEDTHTHLLHSIKFIVIIVPSSVLVYENFLVDETL